MGLIATKDEMVEKIHKQHEYAIRGLVIGACSNEDMLPGVQSGRFFEIVASTSYWDASDDVLRAASKGIAKEIRDAGWGDAVVSFMRPPKPSWIRRLFMDNWQQRFAEAPRFEIGIRPGKR
jgi:hypothetical protein